MTQARLVNTLPNWSECTLYRFWVWDPNTGYTTRRVGYIGESARMPLDRLIEHLRTKDWGDTIAGWEVIDTYPDKTSVLAAEREYTLREKPLYPVENNMGNPDRIPPWQQKQQRAERDAARAATGGNGMRPAVDRPVQRRSRPIPQRASSRPSPAARRRRNVVLGYAAGWLVQALLWWPLLAVCAARWQVQAPGRVWPVLAAGLAGAPLMFGIRRKRHRKAAWLVLSVVTVVLAGMVAR